MLSIPDMALLSAAALIFFGPEQLPKVARKVGLMMRDVQNTSQTFIREMERAADEHDGADVVSRAHLLDEPPVPPVHEYPLEVPAPEPVAEVHLPTGDIHVPTVPPVPLAGHETTP